MLQFTFTLDNNYVALHRLILEKLDELLLQNKLMQNNVLSCINASIMWNKLFQNKLMLIKLSGVSTAIKSEE